MRTFNHGIGEHEDEGSPLEEMPETAVSVDVAGVAPAEEDAKPEAPSKPSAKRRGRPSKEHGAGNDGAAPEVGRTTRGRSKRAKVEAAIESGKD
jgi:hypothetical protein